jgi:uncharacterized RDD family membrane protein YckC
MKTRHIRLVGRDGQAVTPARACARYLLSWLWFLPALAWAYLTELRDGASIAAALGAGVLAYAALSRLQAQGQYWHDAACGTRLVHCKPLIGQPD